MPVTFCRVIDNFPIQKCISPDSPTASQSHLVGDGGGSGIVVVKVFKELVDSTITADSAVYWMKCSTEASSALPYNTGCILKNCMEFYHKT